MSLSKYLKNLSQIYNRPSDSITATDAQTAIDQLNAGANLVGANTKATPVAGDGFVIVDRADSNKLKRVLYSTLATLFGYTPPAGTILQVVSTTLTGTFATSSTSFTDLTGLSVPITPSSVNNKILVIVSMNGVEVGNTSNIAFFNIVRGSTPIAIGGSAGSRTISSMSLRGATGDASAGISLSNHYLDSPSSVSEITYKMQAKLDGNTLYVNRCATDGDGAAYNRTASTITVMEVKG